MIVHPEALPPQFKCPITIPESPCSSEMLNPHGPPLKDHSPSHIPRLTMHDLQDLQANYSQYPTGYMSYDNLPFPSCTLGIRRKQE